MHTIRSTGGRRLATITAALTASALLLTGCGGGSSDSNEKAGSPKTESAPSEKPEAGPLKPDDSTEPVFTDPTYAPGAVQALGGEKAAAAAAEPVVGLIRDLTFSEELITAQEKDLQRRDVIQQAVSKYTTSSFSSDVLGNVDQFGSGAEDSKNTDEAQTAVWTIFVYGAVTDGETITVNKNQKQASPEEGPVLVNGRLRRLSVGVPNGDRTTVKTVSTFQARAVLDGKPVRYGVKLKTDYFVVKSGAGWKVDGDKGSYFVQAAEPE